MNRFLLLLFGFAFSWSLMAQSHWSLALESYVGISGSDRSEGALGNLSSTVLFSDNWQENLYLSRGVGLVAGYRIKRAWEIQVGASFQQVGANAQLTQEEYSLETLEQTNLTTDLRFSQQQLVPSINLNYHLLSSHCQVRPFISIGGQAAHLLGFGLSSKTVQEQLFQNNPELLTREEVYTGGASQSSNAWRIGWFTAFGLQWKRWSFHLRYDWESFPQLRLFPSNRLGYLDDCYACQFAERASTPQLQQASFRLSYRLF